MAKDAYYFSHDANARNDTKILNMRCDYGLEGYAMYFITIEVMREEDGYKLKLDKNTWRALAMQMHSKADAIEKFIRDCIAEYSLFESDGEYFWSNSLLRRMGKVEDVREKRRKAARKRWDEEAKNMQMHEEVDANALQVESKSNADESEKNAKESKRKESKGNKNIYPESVYEIFQYWNSKGISKQTGTDTQLKEVEKAIKKHGKEKIKQAIDNYVEIYKSDHYYSHMWMMDNFMKRGNAIPNFLPEGQVYEEYRAKQTHLPHVKVEAQQGSYIPRDENMSDINKLAREMLIAGGGYE